MGSICQRNEITDSDPAIEIPSALRTSKVSEQDFEVLSLIGRGAFSKVFLVEHRGSSNLYAMKVIPKRILKRQKRRNLSIGERNILVHIRHDFIVTLHFAFQTPIKLHLVEDFMRGGELSFHLRQSRSFSPSTAAFYAAEVLLALEVLHSSGIIYRDLKPANILLDGDGHIRLSDFNLSKNTCESPRAKTFCGSPEYIAPEVLRAEGQTPLLDYWGLGVLLYEMISGHSPFRSRNPEVTFRKILRRKLDWPDNANPQAVDLIDKLLQGDPTQRITGPPLKAHSFFADIQWTQLAAKRVTPPIRPELAHERDLSCFRAFDAESESAESNHSYYDDFSFSVL